MAPSLYQSVKQAMQDLVAPQLEQLRGDFAALRAEMRAGDEALRVEIATLGGELRGELSELRGEFGELRGELRGEVGGLKSEIRRIDDKLTIALELRERIVAIETKLGM